MEPKLKRPTMADIAERAGVGIATVDRVLSGRRKVRGENVRRVFEAAAELGYHATPVIKYRLQQHLSRATFGFCSTKKKPKFLPKPDSRPANGKRDLSSLKCECEVSLFGNTRSIRTCRMS